MSQLQTRPNQRIESSVADYLLAQGFRLIEQNFICKAGQLDLVVQSDDLLIFVDVCWRRDPKPMMTTPYLRPNKKEQWVSAAEQFLKWRPWIAKYPYRFDMIVVSGSPGANIDINWVKNLFTCELTPSAK
jgi:putative endonuclease